MQRASVSRGCPNVSYLDSSDIVADLMCSESGASFWISDSIIKKAHFIRKPHVFVPDRPEAGNFPQDRPSFIFENAFPNIAFAMKMRFCES